MIPRPVTRVVPLHWTMLFGVISSACFFTVAVTGVFLLVFFDPSSETVRYSGSYPLLQGVPVSRAYDSVMHVSLEMRGGLLVRQVHHWAALVLLASLTLQMLCVFFTGAFRRPRQWSWILLALTFLLALGAGWSGYGLPDTELSGTGLRIAQGILIGIPIIGNRASFLLLGGEFPADVVERLYWLHVAILPAMLILVLGVRFRESLRRRPPQFPGPGRTEENVVGLPLKAVVVRAAGLFAITTGVLTLLGGLVTINPVWIYGPLATEHASSGSQPDWYMGWLDGGLRLAPSRWDLPLFGGTLPFGVLIPQAVAGAFLAVIVLWPFLEERATGDRRVHHLPDRPREHPTRTALGVAGVVFFVTLWSAGSTDVVATQLQIAFENQVLALQAALVVGPLVAFQLTRALCLALQSRDHEIAEHGYETGRIMRGLDGAYTEVHSPINVEHYAIIEHSQIERAARDHDQDHSSEDRVA
jgi:ubiquinol-cytochrome c reductase cytochrome b subunit